ncbi:hypothetical protein AMECASPLE_022377 [Ameca splendens]|uniref:Uncharacterized protein n=1 Tax=Ameca splendens TaxID=208324 RepID=A0ABV1A1G9_9TELE
MSRKVQLLIHDFVSLWYKYDVTDRDSFVLPTVYNREIQRTYHSSHSIYVDLNESGSKVKEMSIQTCLYLCYWDFNWTVCFGQIRQRLSCLATNSWWFWCKTQDGFVEKFLMSNFKLYRGSVELKRTEYNRRMKSWG